MLSKITALVCKFAELQFFSILGTRNPWQLTQQRAEIDDLFHEIVEKIHDFFQKLAKGAGYVFLGLLCVGSLVVLAMAGYLTLGAMMPADPLSAQQTSPSEKNQNTVINQARVLTEAGNYREAWKKLHSIEPGSARTYQLEGMMLTADEQYNDAKAAFQRCIRLEPGNPTHVFNLAEVEFMSGNYAAAESQFRIAKAMNPTGKKTRFRLYLCAILQGDEAAAAAIVEDLPVIAQTPDWHLIKATIAFQNGDDQEGHSLLEVARVLYGENVDDYIKTLKRVNILKSPKK